MVIIIFGLSVMAAILYNKLTGVLYYYPKAEDGKIDDQTIVAPTM